MRGQYRKHHPDWQILISHAPGPDPWVKADPVNAAIEATDAEFVLVADADVWCDGLAEALQALKDGARWAVPHTEVRRLDEEGSIAFMDGAKWVNLGVDRAPYIGVRGGGLVMARREVFQHVPMDPRYVGWGAEDMSLGLALNCLFGPCWRGKSVLIHLWHPPQERAHHKYGNPQSHQLYQRYHAARRDPDMMASLLAEIHPLRNR